MCFFSEKKKMGKRIIVHIGNENGCRCSLDRASEARGFLIQPWDTFDKVSQTCKTKKHYLLFK